MQIRWLIRRDMREVLDIENQSFEHRWTEQDFLTYLRERNCIGMVAERNNMIVGYCVYLLFPNALEIINLAISPVLRREGIGSQLIDRMKDKLSQHKRHFIYAAVRETNIEAQMFFKGCGFNAYDIHKNHYEVCNDDAFMFRYQLARSEDEYRPAWKPSNRIGKYMKGTAQ